MKIDGTTEQLKAYLVESGGNLGVKKQRLMFHVCKRDIYSVLDITKIADICLFAFSCKEAQADKVRDNPDEFANAIDEVGYQILNVLRVQGIPPSIGILQHIEQIHQKKRNQIKKLFHRYFVSEFSDEYKFHVIDGSTKGLLDSSYKNLIRMLTGTFARSKLFWKENRSYMIASEYNESNGALQVEGYIRDNYLSCNRLAHITGYGDFKISQIIATTDPYPTKMHKEKKKKADSEMNTDEEVKEVILQQYNQEKADADNVENEIDPFGAEQTWPTNEELSKKNNLLHEEYKDIDMNEEPGEMPTNLDANFKKPEVADDIEKLADQFKKMEIQVVDGENRSQPDFDEEDDDDLSFEDYETQINKTSLKHEKFTNLEKREKDEMDFPDEVDTPLDQPARERFEKYRSVNNIRTCNWDPFETLPPEYAKIWRFENFAQVKKLAIEQTEKEGLPIDGTYVKLILEPCDQKSKSSVELLKDVREKQNLIISTMMPHERKIIVSHFKIKRNEEDKNVIPSKSVLEFHVGFRRFITRPIFSDDYLHTNKAKFYRYLPHDTQVMASAFMPV
mmetsp:Transcript_28797/g.28504  ORF Transcript_28797/g.28504 Transcript_28797/m.28504 type:complete len:563 (-) Transcript_28797:264-1952(-)